MLVLSYHKMFCRTFQISGLQFLVSREMINIISSIQKQLCCQFVSYKEVYNLKACSGAFTALTAVLHLIGMVIANQLKQSITVSTNLKPKLLYIRRRKFSKVLNKRIVFWAQTSFHYDKTTWFPQACRKCYTYQDYMYNRWHHWLCDEKQLVAKCMVSAWWCKPTPYLPNDDT